MPSGGDDDNITEQSVNSQCAYINTNNDVGSIVDAIHPHSHMAQELGRSGSHRDQTSGWIAGMNSINETIHEHHSLVSDSNHDHIFPVFDRQLNSSNDNIQMDLTTGNSKINLRQLDDERSLSYYMRTCERRSNQRGDNYIDTGGSQRNSVACEVDRTTSSNSNKSSDRNGYCNPSVEEIPKDSSRYVDGLAFWTHKMNDYDDGSSPSPVARISERKEDTNLRNFDAVDHTASTTNRSSKNHPPNMVGAVSSKMIQVAPGEYMRLRGAQETWKAVQQDFYIPGTCICCQETLFCIQDAVFVLCPICDVVSPSQPGKILISNGYNGGVGLGFVIDELIQWQTEILSSRTQK